MFTGVVLFILFILFLFAGYAFIGGKGWFEKIGSKIINQSEKMFK